MPQQEQPGRGGVMETTPTVCSGCGSPLPSAGSFCPACGTRQATKPVLGTTGGMPDRIAGALAYLTVLPAVFFLLREPFKRNRFIRFHSWQSIMLAAVTVLLFTTVVLAMGRVAMILAGAILAVGWFILWLVLIVKALQGEMFELPLLGKLAEKQS